MSGRLTEAQRAAEKWRGMTDAEFVAEVRRGLVLITNAGKQPLGGPNSLTPQPEAWLWRSYGDELLRRLAALAEESRP